MRVQTLVSLLALMGCAACGESFSVPTAPGSTDATQQGNPNGGAGSNTGCTPGVDPQCPAVQGFVEGVSFSFAANAGFAACQDANGTLLATRLIITDSTEPCKGAFVDGGNSVAVENGTRTVIIDVYSNHQVAEVLVYASDANQVLMVPSNVSDPNAVQNPISVGDPNAVQDPNALLVRAPPPLTMTATDFHLDSTGAAFRGSFQATTPQVGSGTLTGSFNATACSATPLCISP